MLTTSLTQNLTPNDINFINENLGEQWDNHLIAAFCDAKNMSCPMPLLKAKLALRTLNNQQSLYLITHDKNSQTDIVAFCQKNNLGVTTWSTANPQNSNALFHFIISKNHEKN